MTKRIFITGGASGLGRALAERYARDGWRVAIGDVHEARMKETLAALHEMGATAHGMPCDVRREEDLQAAADWLEGNWGGVDVVVNNAGVAAGGGIADLSMEDWEWITDINVLGVVRGCKVFTPLLRKQGGGHLVNVASEAGLVHPPNMAAYNATKTAVVALSETLRVELAPDDITVSVVCPGFLRTNLAESFRAGSPEIAMITKRFVNRARKTAPEVADLIHRGVARGDFHILTHADGKRAWMAKRLLPSRAWLWIMARESRRVMERKLAAARRDADGET